MLRSPFIVGGLMLAFTGYAIQASDASIGVKYFGTYLIVIGANEAAPVIISWCVVWIKYRLRLNSVRFARLGNNTVGHYKRGISIGMLVTFGTIGGIVASNAFHVQDAPRYLSGRTWIPVQAIASDSLYPPAFVCRTDATVLGFIGIGLILVPLTLLAFWHGNRRRDATQHREEETGTKVEYTGEELKRMGERAPTFRYTL